MPTRPAADKDKATARKPAAKKATSKPAGAPASARAKKAAPAASKPQSKPQQPAHKDGSEVLKEGVSKLFSRGRELLSEKGPGLLSSIERATVVAIDQTSKGITAFEKGANDLEAKVGQGLREMLDRRRTRGSDDTKPKGPKA